VADPDATADHDRVDLDRLVHEPARLRLLTCLFAVESADFLVVMRQAGLTQGNLSSHMTRLEAAGYLQIEKAFVDRRPRTLLRLTATGRTALERYAVSMKRLLAGLHTPDTVKSKPGTAASEPELETASCHHLGDG
jgi:DNA-binding MarR family transcriptional regulator